MCIRDSGITVCMKYGNDRDGYLSFLARADALGHAAYLSMGSTNGFVEWNRWANGHEENKEEGLCEVDYIYNEDGSEKIGYVVEMAFPVSPNVQESLMQDGGKFVYGITAVSYTHLVSYAVAVITIFSVSQYSIYALTNETEPEYYELYVSPDGTGSGDGTLNDPFSTISEARDAIRLMDKTGKDGVTVYLREGVYTQEDTLVFTEEDSGLSLIHISLS